MRVSALKSGKIEAAACSFSCLLFLTPVMSKRLIIYTAEDVANNKSASSCWISRNGKVYNVTRFLDDHPGGDDFILKYAGQDVGEVMKDKDEHEHSDSAYDMMDEYVIGRLGTDSTIVSDGMCS